jgi:hypothetical protein
MVMRGIRIFSGTLLLLGAPFVGWLVGVLPVVTARTGIIWGTVTALVGYLIVLKPAIDGGRRGWMIFKAALMAMLGSVILGILVGALAGSWAWGVFVLCAGLLIGLVLVIVSASRAARGISNIFTQRPDVVSGSVVGTGTIDPAVTVPDGVQPDRL